MPDMWSEGVRKGTKFRDPAFLITDLYEDAFDVRKFFYDLTSAKWPSVTKENGYTRPVYVSAYWEPVVFVRFREFKDVTNKFTGNYGDHKYIMVNNPDRKMQMSLLVTCIQSLDVFNTHAWMEDKPFSVQP